MEHTGKIAVHVAKEEENIWIIQTIAFAFNMIVHEGSTEGKFKLCKKDIKKISNHDLYWRPIFWNGHLKFWIASPKRATNMNPFLTPLQNIGEKQSQHLSSFLSINHCSLWHWKSSRVPSLVSMLSYGQAQQCCPYSSSLLKFSTCLVICGCFPKVLKLSK